MRGKKNYEYDDAVAILTDYDKRAPSAGFMGMLICWFLCDFPLTAQSLKLGLHLDRGNLNFD